MPEVFRHARRRSRFHARSRDEAARARAGERRRAHEGSGRIARRSAVHTAEWQREARLVDDDTSGAASAPAAGEGAAPSSPL